jgi:prevent-host-death family protein
VTGFLGVQLDTAAKRSDALACSAGFHTCCIADFQVGGALETHSLRVWKPATQQTWKSALRRQCQVTLRHYQKSRPVVHQNKCPHKTCASVKSVYFNFMEATLTELRRDTSRVVRAADKGEEVILTEHGEPRYKLQRVRAIDWKKAAAALRAIGPVTFLPRK